MFGGIKKFFSSLMFWKRTTPQIEPPKKDKPIVTIDDSKKPVEVKKPVKPVITDDGAGGDIIDVRTDLPLDNKLPLHYRIAYKEIGVKEIRGSRKHNDRILEYHDTTGDFSDDETPWCASVINWVIIEQYWNVERKCYVYNGVEFRKIPKDMRRLAKIVATGKANARSFLDVGTPVNIDDVKVGDIVIFWRGSKSGWQGHVALVVSIDKRRGIVKALGGNQSNAMNIREYSLDRVLGFRRI